jgi:hypothetical protein
MQTEKSMTNAGKTWLKRVPVGLLAFTFAFIFSTLIIFHIETTSSRIFTDGELMARLFILPSLAAAGVFALATFCIPASANTASSQILPPNPFKEEPYMAQVVGLQWLNPLQRRDYPTEWQLLWTLNLAHANKNDDMLKKNPQKYSSVQAISSIVNGFDGTMSFKEYQEWYVDYLINQYRDNYFSDAKYFYNAHSITDKKSRRELAGIRVEFALPEQKLHPTEAANSTRESIIHNFDIGLPSFPNAWTHNIPPDVRITLGGANAGFTSLAKGLEYLQENPSKTVWVMNWDAPSRPLDRQINENIVLLILAGPDYKTDRAPLAWLSKPASAKVDDFSPGENLPSRPVQAWKAALAKAVVNAGKQKAEIGFVTHDANTSHPESSDRLATLAQTMTEELPELDFMKQTFNTSALLGEMGAGTALTNVALAIAYANHLGKTVLVAGTTDLAQPTATVVMPPAVVRPINPDEPWFRARGGNTVNLPWWGLRHDMPEVSQGYSR